MGESHVLPLVLLESSVIHQQVIIIASPCRPLIMEGQVSILVPKSCIVQGCEDGDIRLVGGSSHLDGRVEICHSGVWGTVCSNSWGVIEARVVCRQLQNISAGKTDCLTSVSYVCSNTLMFNAEFNATARVNGYFGPGEGPIFLDQVQCTGHEDRLLDCPNLGLEVYSCNHLSDAGVTCIPGKKWHTVIVHE